MGEVGTITEPRLTSGRSQRAESGGVNKDQVCPDLEWDPLAGQANSTGEADSGRSSRGLWREVGPEEGPHSPQVAGGGHRAEQGQGRGVGRLRMGLPVWASLPHMAGSRQRTDGGV